MNLLSFKKMAFAALGLLFSVSAQTVLAEADQIFCHTKSGNDWYWTGEARDTKAIDGSISSDLPLLAYRKSHNNGLYVRQERDFWNRRIVAIPSYASGGKMDESRARKFCEALMNMCVTPTTQSYRFVGIGNTWASSSVQVLFSDNQGRDAILACPHANFNEGRITTYNPVVEKSAGITYPR
jgi:hypothetical protein